MTRYACDLHVHSCLSPCADDDMTVNNIAGMAALNGLSIVALTDHNSTRNCPAFFKACRRQGVVPIPGMELTTAEDIHLVCLFETLEAAMAFGAAVEPHRLRIKNKPEIFGNQLVLDADDGIVDREPDLLINATDLSLTEAVELARSHGAAVHPAHIDRESNGIIAILGGMPGQPGFSCVEFNDGANVSAYTEKYGLSDKRVVVSSDAHNLWSLLEGEQAFELAPEPETSQNVRSALIRLLKTGPGEDEA